MKDDIAINTINSYSISEKIGVIKFSSESSTNRPPPPSQGRNYLGEGCVCGGGGGCYTPQGKVKKEGPTSPEGARNAEIAERVKC